jgi:hypothetical protein
MTEQRAEDRGAVSSHTPLSLGVHSGGENVSLTAKVRSE